MAFADDLLADAPEGIRLVAGTLRRGEWGEAFRERRRIVTWHVTEAGLVAPAVVEERGTAVRRHRAGASLLVARSGDGPEALRDAVREAARRAGGSPFFKAARTADKKTARAAEPFDEEESRTARLSAALAHALHDPRGLSLSLSISSTHLTRAVITPREALSCGTRSTLVARGTVSRSDRRRPFAFQSSRPFSDAVGELVAALAVAIRPVVCAAAPEGEVDAVLLPSAAAAFFHEVVGHALEADGPERASVLARVPGAAVAPRGLFVSDDPLRLDLPGAYETDDEGTPAERVPLLLDGRVADRLRDHRAGSPGSNGHGRTPDFRRPPRARMGNLVVEPGERTVEELMSLAGTGVLVREVSAGMADPESGRFVLAVERADGIRRGRSTGPVAPFSLAGDALAALAALDAERGHEAPAASGLAICVKAGDAILVGGAAPAILVRGLDARGGTR